MRVRFLLGSCLLLTLGSAGCLGSSAPLPPVDQITKIEITVQEWPKDVGPKAACKVAFTKRADIDAVIDWLKGIDWSQEGTDLAVVRIPQPDGGIVITTKGQPSCDFGFYWDGRLINSKANRLLQANNMDKLKQIILDACK